jgi:hypothetical protein
VDPVEVARLTASLPLTVLLVLVLMGGYLEWWIYGTIYRAAITTRDAQLADERARADKWEARYLELNMRLDNLLQDTHVDLSDKSQTEKIRAMEEKLALLNQELLTVRGKTS